MVSRVILTALITWAVAAEAQAAPDWRGAGGAIFATESDPGLEGRLDPAPATMLADPVQPYAAEVEVAAAQHRLDPKLLHALIVVESAYRADAVSSAGAAGLTQLMPATASALGVGDRFDVRANLAGGAAFLARQLVRFGDLRLALAAYNAGPERVARLGRIPRISETETYVGRVVDCYLALSAGREVRTSRDCPGAGP